MNINDIDLFEEDLLKMMREFWAVSNNSLCAKETFKFLDRYNIEREEAYELKQELEFQINQEEENERN